MLKVILSARMESKGRFSTGTKNGIHNQLMHRLAVGTITYLVLANDTLVKVAAKIEQTLPVSRAELGDWDARPP